VFERWSAQIQSLLREARPELEDGVDIARLARFFAHESCGQCTQCREGTAWTTKIMERIRDGQGTIEDLDTLLDIAEQMTGKTICVLSDSCAVPVVSGIKKFRSEFEGLIQGRRFHPVIAAVA